MSVVTYSIGDIVVNKNIDGSESWRLIHDGVNVISVFKSNGFTETIHELEIFNSKDLCIDRINYLGLNIPEHIEL